MCGIIGLYQATPIRHEQDVSFKAAVGMMRLRGPDGSGVAAPLSELRLGHTRLAIIDLAAGAQPMRDDASGAVITYNGEVFNFREIRQELEAKGHVFHSHCDTEVVLRSYLEWGGGCVARFNGFFAFAVFDPRRRELFCARDRLGVKPFYYVATPGVFAFASAIPALLKAADMRPEPAFQAVSHYLMTNKTALGEQTLLKNVKTLQPGRSLTLKLTPGPVSEPVVNRYWRLPRLTPEEKLSAPPFAEARDRIRGMLDAAVRKRLVSDVPLGAFLSGGLDSAIIAVCASRHSSFKLPLFCAGSDDESLNEYQYAAMVADQVGSPLRNVQIDAATFAVDMGALVANKGLPLSTPNEISIYRLAAELRKQCVVTLTGEGADEIFGGYTQPHFAAFDYDRCGHLPGQEPEDFGFSMAMMMRYGRGFFVNDTDHYITTCSWLDHQARQELLAADVVATLDDDDPIYAFYDDYFEGLSGLSSFDKRMHLHAEFNLENLLNRVDSSTMAASVEARTPFCDFELADFAFTLPDHYKMDWRDSVARAQGKGLPVDEIDRQNLLVTKRLPREAFRAELPEAVANRKKMSFPVPQQKWFGEGCGPEVEAWCRESDFARSYCRPEAVETMLKNHDRNLWLVANLCLWLDKV